MIVSFADEMTSRKMTRQQATCEAGIWLPKLTQPQDNDRYLKLSYSHRTKFPVASQLCKNLNSQVKQYASVCNSMQDLQHNQYKARRTVPCATSDTEAQYYIQMLQRKAKAGTVVQLNPRPQPKAPLAQQRARRKENYEKT